MRLDTRPYLEVGGEVPARGELVLELRPSIPIKPYKLKPEGDIDLIFLTSLITGFDENLVSSNERIPLQAFIIGESIELPTLRVDESIFFNLANHSERPKAVNIKLYVWRADEMPNRNRY